MKPGEPNVGLHMTAEQVAEGIRDHRGVMTPKPKDGQVVGVADPSIFAEDGDPEHRQSHDQSGARHLPAGRQQARAAARCHGRLGSVARQIGSVTRDGKPMIVFFSTATHAIRTLPALQQMTRTALRTSTPSQKTIAQTE